MGVNKLATFLISLIILALVTRVIYKKMIKKKSGCNCGTNECPTKQTLNK
ncbi:FeoB-associated Cys-rich membrane protein [Vagococcus zengguangii]